MGILIGPPGAASLATTPPHSTTVTVTFNETELTVLYQDNDHLGRPWTVAIDVPQRKDPPDTTRIWFHCLKAAGGDQRPHVNSTTLWTPGSGWTGPWTPTNPRSVPPAVREAVEAALKQRPQEVA